ncbi:YuzD family protein [Staphylococcus americanisciuri]|uniref:YuzD family protein n=1 Tax=Staphylococcus americanisciuri TaxID=2973940 RepID=A0ABT2F2Z9_9STAP|nr:YuzD family protein [Staphylococcus americanisciuri]MCS4486826.1 YuzD family protein [Staphylococcus americanisciuri]
MTKVSVIVYGAETVCASCVNAPSARNTFDWLQTLLPKKYPELDFSFTYIDIINDVDCLTDHDEQFIEQIRNDELFYPLITMNDAYVADGYIQLKPLKRYITKTFGVTDTTD